MHILSFSGLSIPFFVLLRSLAPFGLLFVCWAGSAHSQAQRVLGDGFSNSFLLRLLRYHYPYLYVIIFAIVFFYSRIFEKTILFAGGRHPPTTQKARQIRGESRTAKKHRQLEAERATPQWRPEGSRPKVRKGWKPKGQDSQHPRGQEQLRPIRQDSQRLGG